MDWASLLILTAVLILLALAALLQAGEAALGVVSAPRMHRLERQGNRRAAIVRRLREERETVAGSVLLGTIVLLVSASALATWQLARLFGPLGVLEAAVVVAIAAILFARVLPQAFAHGLPEQVALAAAGLLRPAVSLLRPGVRAMRAMESAASRLLGGGQESGSAQLQELRGAIELHRGGEREVQDERRMLRSVLDLAEVWVSEVMTHRSAMATIDGNLPPGDIVEQVLRSPYTRIPVWLETPDNIIGVLHAKVLLRAVHDRPDLQRLDIPAIAAPAWFIPGSTTLLDQLQAFRRRREHIALVVDEYGALMGLVTLEDILEEIVGDISDESDVPVPGVRPQPDGSYVVSGSVTIRDLNRELDWNLPDQEATTIAGLLMREARQIPDMGQAFDFYGFRFLVLRRVRNQITSIRIRPPRRAKSSGP